jgi:hypothetical protein
LLGTAQLIELEKLLSETVSDAETVGVFSLRIPG